MSDVDKGYELKVLKSLANKYLDETIPYTEESLEELEANPEWVVWELATKIYSQGGHKVELSMVRDIVDSRIREMKFQIAAQRERMAEEVLRIDERNRIAREARRIAEQERMAEEAVRVAEEKRMAEEARRVAEEKARLAAKETRFCEQVNHVLGKFGGDESKAKIFIRVRKIISKYMKVDESEVDDETEVFTVKGYYVKGSYCSDLSTAWGGESDALEILMALEEEFDIEISDEAWGLHTLKKVVDYIAQKIVV